MKNINHLIINKHQLIIKQLILLSALIFIYLSFPEGGLFEYEFKKNDPWRYEDLIAKFDFPIEKSEEEYKSDLEKERSFVVPFYTYDSLIVKEKLKTYHEEFEDKFEDLIERVSDKEDLGFKIKRKKLLNDSLSIAALGFSILSTLYEDGILKLDELHLKYAPSKYIKLQKGEFTERIKIKRLRVYSECLSYIKSKLQQRPMYFSFLLKDLLIELVDFNINYDAYSTEKYFNQNKTVLRHKGQIQKGQKIISEGDLVSTEKFQILYSYSKQYNERKVGNQNTLLVRFGFILLTCLCLSIILIYLYQAQKDVYRSNSKVSFILYSIVFFSVVISIGVKYFGDVIYIIPLCIQPILVRAFFDTRTAFFTFISLLLLSGLIVPNSFEYVFVNGIAGIFAIYSVRKLHYRSQFFMTSLVILLSYIISFIGISLVKSGSLLDINYNILIWLSLNVVITLISLPLITLMEYFGFISELTIFELTDLNKPLLKDLSVNAPGTFQHSLQVANLSESGAVAIGANPLLAKVGALYHDIGKMKAPEYFIENQHSHFNPHSECAPEESAQIIIKHVLDGIELAKKHKLPEMIIDFIRTHHGTSKVEYFYHKFKTERPEEDINDYDFCYPGPIPFSKETSILMFADSVEAASRSLKEPTEESIDKLVDSIFEHKLSNSQLNNAEITLKEINTLNKLYKRMLKSIYHVRISYPTDN